MSLTALLSDRKNHDMMTPLLLLLAHVFVLVAAQSAPLSIAPSQYWEGNDGQWSTFHVQVGTPGQTLRLLPGTSASAGSAMWVVLPEGCSLANPGLADCGERRGALYQSNLSTTWSTEGLGQGPNGALYELITYEESRLGLEGNGSYGFDSVVLGLPGSGMPTLEDQVIAGYAVNDFWLGSLGISPTPFNFTTLNDPKPSLLGTLRSQSLIPSSSWGYTAGAYYKDPPVFGSLTLGGYDSTRRTSSNATFAFGADISRDLLLTLDSITHSTAGSSPLLASEISIFIDSLVTELWLPTIVCSAFEQQFGLVWDDSAELYLLDNETYDALAAQNPTFTFGFAEPASGDTVEIALPYAAFDLTAAQPLLSNGSSRYFPLKRAQDESQYMLGRVFLQEAYVIADYERREFQIAQAAFPSTDVDAQIVAIHPPGEGNSTTGAAGPAPDSSDKLKSGAIAGIAVGAVATILLVVGLSFWRFRRRRTTQKLAELPGDGVEVAEKRGDEAHSNAIFETDGREKVVSWQTSELSGTAPYKRTSELDSKAMLPSELGGSQPMLAELESGSLRGVRPVPG